jgi:hypothetical protein
MSKASKTNIEKRENVKVPDHSASVGAKGEMNTVKKVADVTSKPQAPEAARQVDSDWVKYPKTCEPCESGH